MQKFEHKRAGNKIRANKKMGNGCAKAPVTTPLGEPLLQARGGGQTMTTSSRAAALAKELTPERYAQIIVAMEELVMEMDILKSRIATLEGSDLPEVKSKVKSDKSWIKDEQQSAIPSTVSSDIPDIDTAVAEPKEEEVIHVPMTPTKPPTVVPEIHAMSTPDIGLEEVKSTLTVSREKEQILISMINNIPGDYNVSCVTQMNGSECNVIPLIGKKKVYCVSSTIKAPGGDRKVLKLFNAKRKPAKVLKLNEVCMNLGNYVDHEVESDISNLELNESQGLNALVDKIRDEMFQLSLTHIG